MLTSSSEPQLHFGLGNDPTIDRLTVTWRARLEEQLGKAMPKARWTRTSDTLILHGRRVCRPKPLCGECAAQDNCDYFAHAAR